MSFPICNYYFYIFFNFKLGLSVFYYFQKQSSEAEEFTDMPFKKIVTIAYCELFPFGKRDEKPVLKFWQVRSVAIVLLVTICFLINRMNNFFIRLL